MQEYSLIKCKWQCGAYELKEMVQSVRKGDITKDQFFEITRYNFDGVVELYHF